jgi:hypothetical protein
MLMHDGSTTMMMMTACSIRWKKQIIVDKAICMIIVFIGLRIFVFSKTPRKKARARGTMHACPGKK